MSEYKKGRYRVTQLLNNEFFSRDFDAEEWRYYWITRGDGIQILRLDHDNDPEAVDTFDFVEFSAPVNIDFEYEG